MVSAGHSWVYLERIAYQSVPESQSTDQLWVLLSRL